SSSMRPVRFLVAEVLLLVATGALIFVARGQATTPVSLVVTGGTIVTMDRARQVIPVGAIAINADKIVEVGSADAIAGRYSAAQRIDVRGQVILPGLINTHGHAPMV